MTKCIVLGEKPHEIKEVKKINFQRVLSGAIDFIEPTAEPKNWMNIELICKNYSNCGLDLMFAYNNQRDYGALYLGQWNDGLI